MPRVGRGVSWVHGWASESWDPEHCQDPGPLWGASPSGFPGPLGPGLALEPRLLFAFQGPPPCVVLPGISPP